MKITKDIRVSEVLEVYPHLLDVIASYNPHFEKLRNKMLRLIMAPRVRLEQAARIADVNLEDFLATLNRAIGEEPEAIGPSPEGTYQAKEGIVSERAEDQGESVFLDVRGLEPPEPMIKVLEALNMLREGQTLIVGTHRRPMFLYPKLDERGYEHVTEEKGPNHFRITIRKKAAVENLFR